MIIAVAVQGGIFENACGFCSCSNDIFPNLSAATTAFRTMLEMGLGDAIGPIQMGLNKPVHFISVNAGVRDIINLATIASLDAAVLERNSTPIDK